MVFQIGIGIAIAISISDEDRDRDLDFGDRGHALNIGKNTFTKKHTLLYRMLEQFHPNWQKI